MTPVERLTLIVKKFHVYARAGQSHDAAYWLNRFHNEMDIAEKDGMRFDDLPLPEFQPLNSLFRSTAPVPCWPATSINWGQHHGFTNQRRADGSTELVNIRVRGGMG